MEPHLLACAGGLKGSDINQSIQMDRLIDINLDIEGLKLTRRRSRRRPRGAQSARIYIYIYICVYICIYSIMFYVCARCFRVICISSRGRRVNPP